MSISYAITVCNEFVEIQKLITFLLDKKRKEDEIIVLYDKLNGDKGVEEYLRSHSINSEFNWYPGEFRNDFSKWKNTLISLCSGDYIFQIDADEIPHNLLLENLPIVLERNPNIELFGVPRVNTVEGLTDKHIQKWRWNVNEKGWINWPDYQTRIWKNKEDIKWENKVHERIGGHKTFSFLPQEEIWSLYHNKDIKRQEKQNQFYDTL